MEQVRKLLASGLRVRHIAEARLRPHLVIEDNLREMHSVSTRRASANRVVKALKAGQWASALPLVSGIVTNPEVGLPVILRIGKTEGLPIKVDQTAPMAVVFKHAKVEDRYPFPTTDLANNLHLSINKVVALAKLFQLKGDDDFHMGTRTGKSSSVQRYAQKTLDVLQKVIDTENIDALWAAYFRGEKRDWKPILAN